MASSNKVVALKEEKRKGRFGVPPRVQAAIDAGDAEACLDALTTKQRLFCEEYLKDLNASRAVLRAGYKTENPNRIGHELMQKEGVRFAIDGLMADRAEKTKVDANFVIQKVLKSIERSEESRNEAALLRGAELLARHLGMFVDKTEISGPEAGAIELERKTREDVAAFQSAIVRLAGRGDAGEDAEGDDA